MKKVLFFVSLFVVLVLSACVTTGSPAPGEAGTQAPSAAGNATLVQPTVQTGGGISGPAELQYIFDIPLDPIQVTPSLDSSRQVEAVIPATGGSLSATDAGGTTYRLDIPAEALVTDTLVRMTPVDSLEGMVLGSTSYTVQLEPEGLQLYDFAVLTIIPSQEVPVDQQIFFGYQGAGENVVLAPPVVDSNEIQIKILHFSGYGLTKGFLADLEPVRARIGGDAEARLQSAIAEQLTKVRQEQLLGIENGTEIDWEGFFQQWEDEVVKPRLAAAAESCAAGRLAIQTVLSYERQRQLLGMEESSIDSALIANGLIDTVAEVCMKEEFELCRDEHIIHRIIPAWLGIERQFQLLGLDSGGPQAATLENVKTYVRRCLSFQLEFHSEAVFDAGDGDGYNSDVDSKIKIQFNPDEFTMRGQAPLVNTTFKYQVPDCAVTSMRGGGTFGVMSLSYISDTKTPADEVGYVRDLKLIYFPGNTSESFTVSCPDSGSYTSPPSPLWTGIYLVTHESELGMSEGGYLAEDWEILGGDYYAKKEWIKEDAEIGITEVGSFKLYHRPE